MLSILIWGSVDVMDALSVILCFVMNPYTWGDWMHHKTHLFIAHDLRPKNCIWSCNKLFIGQLRKIKWMRNNIYIEHLKDVDVLWKTFVIFGTQKVQRHGLLHIKIKRMTSAIFWQQAGACLCIFTYEQWETWAAQSWKGNEEIYAIFPKHQDTTREKCGKVR